MKKIIFILMLLIGFQINAQNDSIQNKGWKINQKQTYSAKTLAVIDEIYFVDSKFISNLDSKKIVSVNVLKGEKAIEKYGNEGKFGVIEIKTKNYNKELLERFSKLYAFEYKENNGKKFLTHGTVYNCEKEILVGVTIQNLNTNEIVYSNFDGNFTITTTKDDVLAFEYFDHESKRILVEDKTKLNIELKEIPTSDKIILEKPVIYLYPKEKTELTINLEVNGKLLTTFPKYDKEWKIIAEPNGQLFDLKTKRNYSSLFWDANVELPITHYQHNDGFVVNKENLTQFLIEKLEYIGLNNQETNEFIQFWLPILEKNEHNFIHFLINDECNEIAKLNVSPKPDSIIRIYMEFYKADKNTIHFEQKLQKLERNGFTLIEWGGSEIGSKILKKSDEF